MTTSDVSAEPRSTTAQTAPNAQSRRRPRFPTVLTAVLMPVGPAAIAVIRLIFPVDAAAALAAPATMEVVSWLGFVAMFTLIPGAFAAVSLLRDATPRLWVWTGAILLPGYLAMVTLGFRDTLWAAAPAAGLSVAQVESIGAAAEAVGPGPITLLIFVIGHIVGNVLLGAAALRGRLMPVGVAIGLLISQPLHLAAVIIGSGPLDLVAWGLTALGMGFLGVRYLRTA